tara:strand:+ start:152 stop:376 length:225 start_codon:yes stop_codon:yes gene_type:complete
MNIRVGYAPYRLPIKPAYRMNPRILVDGNTATGIWYIIGPWNNTADGKQIWMTARYYDDYLKVDGKWKYSQSSG